MAVTRLGTGFGSGLRRLPRPPIVLRSSGLLAARWVEAVLAILVVVQATRVLWAIVTPVGLYGDWRARQPAILPPAARLALFGAFDPFYRDTAGGGGQAQVTALALQLFGIRLNEGSGQGSAIIATPDGVQSSFVTGDEIVPGVRLKSVAYDHVVIDRGGTAETLFLDQSGGAGAGQDGNGNAAPEGGVENGQAQQPLIGGGGETPLTSQTIARDIGFSPRGDGARISGIVVTRKGNGEGFEQAGFQPGDVVTQVNGRSVASLADIQALQAQLRPGARLSLMVERGAATVPVAVTLGTGE